MESILGLFRGLNQRGLDTKNVGMFLLLKEGKDGKQTLPQLQMNFSHLSSDSPIIIQDLNHWALFSVN